MLARSLLPLLVATVMRAQSLQLPPALAGNATDSAIYALRVDPAVHRGFDYVLLLDEVVVRLEADWGYRYTGRRVAQILTSDGVAGWSEFTFPYTPPRQRFRLNWIRVIGPDGSVLRDGPAHQQETSPTVDPAAPVYSDRRALQMSVGAVVPGTLVDVSFTWDVTRPSLSGDLLLTWPLNDWVPVRRARFVLDTPRGLEPRLTERNLSAAPTDTVVADRRVRTWLASELPAVMPEYYAGSPNEVIQSITVSGDASWRDVAVWYGSLVSDRYDLTAEILQAHAAELAAAGTLDDSLRATHRWVAQDFRHVSLSLGDGGYRPRPPGEVFQTRFGDCKDKTTLFVSLARHMGLPAYPVLVNAERRVDSLLPSMKQFDHVIAAVERSGRTEYVDVTSPLTPYGELPPALHGRIGLALATRDGAVVRLPTTPPDSNRYESTIVGALGRDGRFAGRVTVSALGTEQYELRQRLADIDEQDAAGRDAALREFAWWTDVVIDSARHSDGRDLTVPPSLTIWFTVPDVIGAVGNRYYFNLPLPSYSSSEILRDLDGAGARRFPIDVSEVNSPSVYRSAIEFRLPDGWKAELPAPVSVSGAFGYYHADYRQVGRTLWVSREMGGLRGLLPPDSAAALLTWLQAVADDRTGMIVLDRGAGLVLVADKVTAESPLGADKVSKDAAADPAGPLAEIVLRLEDLPTGMKETANDGTTSAVDFLLDFAATQPVGYSDRSFQAEQLVSPLGGSHLLMLQVGVAVFRTDAEARRPVDLLEFFDLQQYWTTYLSRMATDQWSPGAVRLLSVDGVGDRASGAAFEMISPLATFDVAILFAARGRVGIAAFVMGAKGMLDADVAGLLRVMDERVQRHTTYLTDLAPDSAGSWDVLAADSALAASTDIALNTIPYYEHDTAHLTAVNARFRRENGWPTYTLEVEGTGATFPFGASQAIGLIMEVTLHETEAQALKQVLSAEQVHEERAFKPWLETMSDVAALMDTGDSTEFAIVAVPPIGARAVGGRARLRGAMRMDIDGIVLARGRVSATVFVMRPPGTSEIRDVTAIAREMSARMAAVPAGASGTAPARPLIEAVRRVVDAEHAVDSLLNARELDAAFGVVERTRRARATVDFDAATWNKLCWWASLYGAAERALAACDAAVAPDTTDLSHRDSRGLARALAGDLGGAQDDFAYVVANGEPGEVLEQRARWLEMLRAGENPFTEAVLAELRRQSDQ